MPNRTKKRMLSKRIDRPTRIPTAEEIMKRQKTQGISFTVVDSAKRRTTTSAEPSQRAPSPPAWLPPEARPVWKRTVKQMIQERTWRTCFEATLGIFSTLFAQFQQDPQGFSPTKTVQLRLLAGDLGLSPATVDRVVRRPG